MANAFNATRKTVHDLLKTQTRERIVVPAFQRGYMWQKKHVVAFWNDIITQQEASKTRGGASQHFLGPIVTQFNIDKHVIYLLDGQQRLATATILLSVMRDIARYIGNRHGLAVASDFARDIQAQLIEKVEVKEGTFVLELGETDAAYFRETIQRDPPEQTPARLRTHRNIKEARKTLADKLEGKLSGKQALAAISELKDLKQVIMSDLIMADIPVESEHAAFKIFETLNDRGLRLSAPDLLLNFLMSHASGDDQRIVRDFWTQMLEELGKHDIARFLRHMWVSKYGDLKRDDLYTALKDKITTSSLSSADFVRACASECEKYVDLVTINQDVINDKTLAYVRALIKELNIQAALPLLLSSYVCLEPDDFRKVTMLLLVFVTRYSIIGNLDPSEMEDLLFRLAGEVRTRMETASDQSARQKASNQCASFIKDQLIKNAPSDSAVETNVASLILDRDEAKYIVSRIANHIQSKTKEITLKEANLEHVYPQNPDENEWGGRENQERMNDYLWHIGNLTIFGTRLNRAAANREYPIKQQHYLAKTEVVMTKQLASKYSNWTEVEIQDRANSFTKLIIEIWNFDNTSRI